MYNVIRFYYTGATRVVATSVPYHTAKEITDAPKAQTDDYFDEMELIYTPRLDTV